MTHNVRLVPAERKHINRIANNMRGIDRVECEAFGRTPKHALRDALSRSDTAWTAMVDGQPEAMLGVVIESVMGGDARPWMLGTDEVMNHPRALLLWGDAIVAHLHNSNFTLSNLVSARNHKAIRLLKRWGFTVSEEQQDVGGEMFRPFRKEPA